MQQRRFPAPEELSSSCEPTTIPFAPPILCCTGHMYVPCTAPRRASMDYGVARRVCGGGTFYGSASCACGVAHVPATPPRSIFNPYVNEREAAQHARDHESEQCSASQACNKPTLATYRICTRLSYVHSRLSHKTEDLLYRSRAGEVTPGTHKGPSFGPRLPHSLVSGATTRGLRERSDQHGTTVQCAAVQHTLVKPEEAWQLAALAAGAHVPLNGSCRQLRSDTAAAAERRRQRAASELAGTALVWEHWRLQRRRW